MRGFLHRGDNVVANNQNVEFVSANAGEKAVFWKRCRQAVGDLTDEIIPAGMTNRVIDILEAINIKKDNGQFAAGACPTRCRLAQAFNELKPVRQLGHAVSSGVLERFGFFAAKFFSKFAGAKGHEKPDAGKRKKRGGERQQTSLQQFITRRRRCPCQISQNLTVSPDQCDILLFGIRCIEQFKIIRQKRCA